MTSEDQVRFSRWMAEFSKTVLKVRELNQELSSVREFPEWFTDELDHRVSQLHLDAEVLFLDTQKACNDMHDARRAAKED